MKCFVRLIRVLIIVVLLYSAFPRNVYAYIGPGGVSYIIQLIIGVLVGGLFAIKLFWSRIKAFIKDFFSK